MGTTITIHSKKEIETITREEVDRILEPYKKVIDNIHVRLIDLENMIRRNQNDNI